MLSKSLSQLQAVLLDIRFGLRMLSKNLGFTTVAVLSLALGIGASTAVFSLVNAILLGSLPVPNPHELRVIEWSGSGGRFSVSGCVQVSPGHYIGRAFSIPIYKNLRERCAEQADVFGYADMSTCTIRARREPFTADGLMVSENFFVNLQTRPLIGRLFEPGEDSLNDGPGAVIAYSLWEREFGLDPNALGQSILLNGRSHTVIGVLPSGYPGVYPGKKTEFYVSLEAQASDWPKSTLDVWLVHLMARIKPGVGDAQFLAACDVAFANAAEGLLKEPKIRIERGKAGPAYTSKSYQKPLLLLLGVVGVVILVVCANLAGLTLVRGAARQHEFAVRSAIGAGRWRLIRQTLTESLLLSFLGSGLGIVFSLWGKDIVSRLIAGTREGLHYDASLDAKVLIFTLIVTAFTALLSGLLPALRSARVDPLSGMKARILLGAMRVRSGRALVIAQVALSLLLLTGAGLYLRTLVNIVQINPGFSMDNLILLQVNPHNAGYRERELESFWERTINSLAAIPGVHSAAITQYAILGGRMSGGGFFTLPDRPAEDGSKPTAHRLTVSESFFETMGVPLRVGRKFTPSDSKEAPKVVIVNETFVRQYLSGVNPIGQILRSGSEDWRIAGVCADIKYTDVKGETPPTVYYSYRQDEIGAAFFVLNTPLPSSAIANAARKTIAALDPNVPIIKTLSQKQVRDESIAKEWMFAILCGSLAALAVLLSCIGLYGLMAYNVSQRTGEIGVRMALGAERRHIVWPILRDALSMTAAGVLIGGLAALALTHLIRNQLYGVEPNDPITLAVSIGAIVASALLAAWLPARRAAKVDPMTALRCE